MPRENENIEKDRPFAYYSLVADATLLMLGAYK